MGLAPKDMRLLLDNAAFMDWGFTPLARAGDKKRAKVGQPPAAEDDADEDTQRRLKAEPMVGKSGEVIGTGGLLRLSNSGKKFAGRPDGREDKDGDREEAEGEDPYEWDPEEDPAEYLDPMVDEDEEGFQQGHHGTDEEGFATSEHPRDFTGHQDYTGGMAGGDKEERQRHREGADFGSGVDPSAKPTSPAASGDSSPRGRGDSSPDGSSFDADAGDSKAIGRLLEAISSMAEKTGSLVKEIIEALDEVGDLPEVNLGGGVNTEKGPATLAMKVRM
jgi:hypothetical protein